MNRCRIAVIAALTTIAALLTVVPSAGASFHLMQIRAVFLGPMDASFVELQMTADGQNFVSGHPLVIYNAAGTPIISYPVASNVANGQNQRTILFADSAQPTPPDFNVGSLYQQLSTVSGGGALCFDNVDCVSWGAFTGNANLPSSAGTPMGGLSASMVAVRKITAGCATALDAPDDTNNSLADFAPGVGYPVKNNAATPDETLCPSSGTPGKKKRVRKCKKKPSKNSAIPAKKKKCKKKKK